MSDDKVIVHDDTLEKARFPRVLVWEIYADGAEPYPGLTRLQTRAKIVVQNYRMEMPKDTPKSVAEIVYSCWEKDPAKRPEMSRIFRMLRDISDRSKSGN
ncbi:hypothetical protein OSTOST_15225 [Ostertagia ostertagi]